MTSTITRLVAMIIATCCWRILCQIYGNNRWKNHVLQNLHTFELFVLILNYSDPTKREKHNVCLIKRFIYNFISFFQLQEYIQILIAFDVFAASQSHRRLRVRGDLVSKPADADKTFETDRSCGDTLFDDKPTLELTFRPISEAVFRIRAKPNNRSALVFEDNIYHRNHASGVKMYWRCAKSNKQCKARLITTLDSYCVSNGVHNHASPTFPTTHLTKFVPTVKW